MANRMILNETAWFGRGAINALTDEAVRRGYRKALIVTDSTLARCGVAAKVTDKLDAAGLAWDIFSDVIPNPTIARGQAGAAGLSTQRGGLPDRHRRRFAAGIPVRRSVLFSVTRNSPMSVASEAVAHPSAQRADLRGADHRGYRGGGDD